MSIRSTIAKRMTAAALEASAEEIRARLTALRKLRL